MMPKRGKKIEEETEVVEIEATKETEAIQADPSLIVRLYLHQLHLFKTFNQPTLLPLMQAFVEASMQNLSRNQWSKKKVENDFIVATFLHP